MTTSIIFQPESLEWTKDNYLGALLQQCEARTPVLENEWLDSLRKKAASVVVQSSIPTKNDEEWHFTDLSDLVKLHFHPAEKVTVNPFTFSGFILSEANQTRIVFVNGVYSPELSDLSGLPEGIYVGNLSGLSISHKEKIVKYLARQEGAAEVFTALNTAGLTDVGIIWADPHVIVETPIHLLFLSVVTNSSAFSQPRTLVIAESGSSLQLVEYYGAIAETCSDRPQNRPYLTNAVTEIWLEENSQVNHSRIQRESGDGFHLAKTAIAQGRASRYTCNEISLGGKLYRHNLAVFQTGEQTETRLNGLTMIARKQFADTHSAVFLTKPHGITEQLHKCIVDDSAHAVFSGKIFVPKTAQLTNASQLNRNLILSPKGRVNTKPELQITADNVKCSHGATVSQLEADEVFYLRSRGLNEYAARHLLLDAFAAEILERIPLPSLRHRLTQCVACRTLD
jgi:Fe-S cluster assembly protein SufD